MNFIKTFLVAAVACGIATGVAAQAIRPLSQLPSATLPICPEIVPLVQSGATKQAPACAFGIPYQGSAAPTPLATYQSWWDTSTNPPTLRIYDGSSWDAIGQLDPIAHQWMPPSLATPTFTIPQLAGTVQSATDINGIGTGVGTIHVAGTSNWPTTGILRAADNGEYVKYHLTGSTAISVDARGQCGTGSLAIAHPNPTNVLFMSLMLGCPTSGSTPPQLAIDGAGKTYTNGSAIGTAATRDVGTGAGQLCLTDATCTFSGTKTFTVPIIVQLNTDGGTLPGIFGGSGLQAVGADGTNVRLQLNAFNNGTSNDNSSISLVTARGTMLSPAALQSGDVYGSLNGWGYDGGAYQHCGDINIIADENWSAAGPFKSGTRIEFATCVDGSQTSIVRGTIGGSGGLVWGSPTGGDKGAGAINAEALYQNTVAVAVLGANTWPAAQIFQKANTSPAGNTGTGTMLPMGVVHTITASAGTATGTSEQTLHSYSLPGNSLDVAGRNLRINACFKHAANTDTVTSKLYFGAEVISDGGVAVSGSVTCLQTLVLKTGSSTQNVIQSGRSNGSLLADAYTAATETDTAPILIRATGTDGTSAANDDTLVSFTVEYMN